MLNKNSHKKFSQIAYMNCLLTTTPTKDLSTANTGIAQGDNFNLQCTKVLYSRIYYKKLSESGIFFLTMTMTPGKSSQLFDSCL